jgi:hypothetical protein
MCRQSVALCTGPAKKKARLCSMRWRKEGLENGALATFQTDSDGPAVAGTCWQLPWVSQAALRVQQAP